MCVAAVVGVIALAAAALAAVVAPVAGAAPVDSPFTATVAAADAGTFSSTLFPADHAFPDGGGAQRAVSRDCGYSTELPGARSLWVFCDTAVYDGLTGTGTDRTGSLIFTPSATAALATTAAPTAESPVALREATYPAIDPRFVTSAGTYGASDTPIVCPGGSPSFAWTAGLVTLPGTGTVVDFYQDHCPDGSAGFPEYDMGVAEYTATASGFDDASSLVADARYESVLKNPTPGSVAMWSYGYGPVADATHIYLYGSRRAQYDCTATCTLLAPGSVTVARVKWANQEYRSGANYEFFTGRTGALWVADLTQAAEILPDQQWPGGDGLSVAWVPEVGRYVMAHGNSTIGGSTGAAIRTSATPWGPWSAPIDVSVSAASSYARPLDGCTDPTPCRTFVLHPALTSGGQLHLSYVRENDWADSDGTVVTFGGSATMRVRLGSLPLAALPTPPPATTLLSQPADPSPTGTATFTFSSPGRAKSVDDPSPLPAATPGPITFRCSLDGSAEFTCASPWSRAGLTPGRHSLTVRAVNGTGTVDPVGASWSWTVDGVAPQTTISSGPASPSNPSGSVFRFAGTDDRTTTSALTFRCSLDGAAASPCTSPHTAMQATSGQHTMAVAAVDLAGNVDPTPAHWTWTVDTEPSITITQGPTAFTNRADETVAFTVADDHVATADLRPKCSLDGAAATACTSPLTLRGLLPGAHVLSITAVDGVGNVGRRDVSWIVDTGAPTARVTTDAAGSVPRTDATLTLSGTDDRAPSGQLKFRCAVDGATAATCVSPLRLTGLVAGAHSVVVTAIDPAGNVSSPVTTSWVVDLGTPTATIETGPGSTSATSTVTFTFRGTDDRTAAGSLRFECSSDGAAPTACTSPLTVTGLLPGAHSLSVVAIDAAGNRSTPATRAWTMSFVFTGAAPPAASTGVPYSHTLATNAPPGLVPAPGTLGPVVSFAVTAGTLPSGMWLTRVGTISGTSREAGDTGPITVTATAPWGTTSRTFTLPVKETKSISGVVTNRVTGVGVKGLRVRAFTLDGLLLATAWTGSAGTYSLGYLYPGSYRLSFVDITDEAYVAGYSGGATSLATATAITVADGTTATADAALQPLNTVGGTVTDSQTKAPLVGIRVAVLDAAGGIVDFTDTAADGTWNVKRLASGTYRLRFADPTGAHAVEFWSGSATFEGAAPITLTTGAPVDTAVALDPFTAVGGTVTARGTGLPISGANVALADATGTPIALARSEGDGRFAFPVVVLGTYSLLFGDPSGAHAAEVVVGISPRGGTLTVDADLDPMTAIPASFDSWSAFVTRQYRDLTDSLPSAADRARWVDNLESGRRRPGELVDELRGGEDNVVNVDPTTRLYRAFLGRAPDAGGLRYWIERRRDGMTLPAMADTFAGSREFRTTYGALSNRAFVTRIYVDVLGRAADPNGVTFWTRQLDTRRRTRGEVMIGFSESTEYRAQQAANTDMAVAHILVLGRAATPAEATLWTARAKAGTLDVFLLDELLRGDAYAHHIGA